MLISQIRFATQFKEWEELLHIAAAGVDFRHPELLLTWALLLAADTEVVLNMSDANREARTGMFIADLENSLRLGEGVVGMVVSRLQKNLYPQLFKLFPMLKYSHITNCKSELLKYLAQHPGRVFTRAQLLQEIWGYDYFGGTRTVDVHIRRLRSKLGPEFEAIIGTVRNVGYRFTLPGKDSLLSERV